ncbi:MAG: DUF1573 domain-containing protein [Planctomycetaceae bacterium]
MTRLPARMRRRDGVRGYALVCAVLALVLLTAAGLKAYALFFGANLGRGVFAAQWLQLAAMEAEALLGLWLLSGLCPAGTRRAALGVFAVLAGIAGTEAVLGAESCGCFGALDVSPWAALGLDAGAVLVLAVVAPATDAGRSSRWRRLIRSNLWQMLLIGTGALTILYGLTFPIFGSPAAALAWIQGSRVTISPEVIDLGECAPGEKRLAVFEITNREDRPVTIVGGTTTCACTTTQGLPVTVPPGETRTVPVTVTIVGTESFSQTVTLYRDGQSLGMLQGRIDARIREPSTQNN